MVLIIPPPNSRLRRREHHTEQWVRVEPYSHVQLASMPAEFSKVKSRLTHRRTADEIRELVINLKTAKALALTIPNTVIGPRG
jgi:hypothetical protein